METARAQARDSVRVQARAPDSGREPGSAREPGQVQVQVQVLAWVPEPA